MIWSWQDGVHVVVSVLAVMAFVGVWLLRPSFKEIVNKRVSEIEKTLLDRDNSAHAAILTAVNRVREDFEKHNMNEFAHPNLSFVSKFEEELKALAKEIASNTVAVVQLREAFEAGRTRRRS